jgi:uncharacterized protein
VGWLQLALLIVAVDLVVQALLARHIAGHFEKRPKLRARLFPAHPLAASFTVRTSDGLTLRGSILSESSRPARGVVVYCHEFGANRWSFQNYFTADATEGFDVVTFDFRNAGSSDQLASYHPMHWLTRHELRDADAVIDFVRSQPRWRGLPVIVAGSSRGGNAALAIAARRDDVDGVLAIGAFSTHQLAMQHLLKGIRQRCAWVLAAPRWHIRTTLEMAIAISAMRLGCRYVRLERMLRSLHGRPVLLVAGQSDSHIPEDMPERIRGLAGPAATLCAIAGGRHNTERDADPDRFDEALAAFLASVTGDAGEVPAELASAA